MQAGLDAVIYLFACNSKRVQYLLILRSDHLVISVDIDFIEKSRNEHPYQRNVYSYSKADWDGFHDYLRDVPRPTIFGYNVKKSAKEI